jgi:tetratricopeptide (TPR) repeat protein
MRFLENCVNLYPAEIEAWTTLGIILVSLGEVEHGIRSFDRALAIDPDYPFAQWNKSLALLSMGNYAEGWRLYEARWQLRGESVPKLHADLPLLPVNQATDNLDLLLVAEQGLGDCIQFVRYAAMFIEQGARVHLHVPKALVRLFASLQSHSIAVKSATALEDLPPRADFFLPMMSSPAHLGLGHPPKSTPFPYLSASPEKIATWKPRMSLAHPRVGLVWYGGSAIQMKGQETINQFRNLGLWQLSNLLRLEVNFVGLQRDGIRDEDRFGTLLADIPTLSSRWQLLGPLLEAFDDTAAVIEELDLVISVDTSVAHLAAAMHKPVWILHRHGGCWRWMHKRQDSDWYPSVRIFCQKNPQNWNETIDEIREALESFLVSTS